MKFIQIFAGILALILALAFVYRHKILFKFNSWMRERVFSDELVLFSGGRVAVLLMLLGGIAIFSGLGEFNLQPIKANIAGSILKQARTDLKEGRHRKVINRCKILMRSNPKNIEAMELLISAWWAQGEKDLAREMAESIIQQDPQNQLAKSTLAKVPKRKNNRL